MATLIEKQVVATLLPPDSLYDRDFCAWADEQVRLLSSRRFETVDLQHLIEEINAMGSEQAFALQSALEQALVHLLKLALSSANDPRKGWQTSVIKQRVEIDKRLKRNPSLKSRLGALFDDAWQGARCIAQAELEEHGETPAIPDACPFSLENVMNREFWPG